MASLTKKMTVAVIAAILLATAAAADRTFFWTTAVGPYQYDANMVPIVTINTAANATDVHGRVLGTADYDDTIFTVGWDQFTAAPDRSLFADSPLVAWYTAGYSEGYLLMERINQTMTAQQIQYNAGTAAYVDTQIAYMRATGIAKMATDPFWAQIVNQLVQMQGIADGYKARQQETGFPFDHTFADVFRSNIFPEYTDIESAVAEQNNSNTVAGERRVTRDGKNPRVLPVDVTKEHCSALIKVTDSDLFFGQSTWFQYIYYPGRVYKTYVMETAVSMSGNAGRIHSCDDWYQTSNLLGAMETSNEFSNPDLYLLIKPNSVAEFMRVMAANYLATNGKEWVEYFSTNHSGTYCNQWMVLDYKLYTKGMNATALPDNTFWLAEEIPGHVSSGDLTPFLREKGYWASYNIPYFKDIYDLSYFNYQEEEYGTFFNWEMAPRAQIFRRDNHKVTDLVSMQKMLRYNDWEHDPLSAIPNCTGCNPTNSPSCAIAARFDLAPKNASFGNLSPSFSGYFSFGFFGSLDGKIGSHDMITNGLKASFQQGPTHDEQPAFEWPAGNAKANLPGMPQRFDFAWETFTPQLPIAVPSPLPASQYVSVTAEVFRRAGDVSFDANGVPQMNIVVGLKESGNIVANGLVPLATAIYNESGLATGWDYVTVIGDQTLLAGDDASTYQVWYGLGVAEGYATQRAITDVLVGRNYSTNAAADNFVLEHIAYMRNQSLTKQTPFWKQIRRQLLQIEGLVTGYNLRLQHNKDTTTEPATFFKLFLMSFRDEYDDVSAAVAPNAEARTAIINARPNDYGEHCSGLVKVTANDVFLGQLTWAPFNILIHKQHKSYVTNGVLTMSANAGRIISGDDWYQTPARLMVQETTNEFMTESLYDLIKPQCVSEFMRVLAANYMATTAAQWVQIYSTEPSGTYNNQWMVFDDKMYVPGTAAADLPDGIFYIAEEIPGTIESGDMTPFLREHGYWASYNIPYNYNIAKLSGFVDYAEQYGNYYSWLNTPRAVMFRERQANVTDLTTMLAMMRYNDYQNDPNSAIPNCTSCSPSRSPGVAISSRFDLVPADFVAPDAPAKYARKFTYGVWGGSDVKVASSSMLRDGYKAAVWAGPTNDQQPTFSWNNNANSSSYGAAGLVQYYNFPKQIASPAVVTSEQTSPAAQYYVYDGSKGVPATAIYTATTPASAASLLENNFTVIYVTADYEGDKHLMATVAHNKSSEVIGWEQLTVSANQNLFKKHDKKHDDKKVDDKDGDKDEGENRDLNAWYAAGVAEGYATIQSMKDSYASFNYSYSDKAFAWIEAHLEYMRNNSLVQGSTSPYWRQVRKQLLQMEGLAVGFNLRAQTIGDATRISSTDVLLMNLNTEIGDIENAVDMTSGKGRLMTEEIDRCSSLVKITAEDAFMSHVTWAGYEYLVGRQYKTYAMEVTVSMTSNAGIIASGDDWMISSTNIAAQETTLGFRNASLNALIKPECVSEFMRGMIASYLATTAKEWVDYFITEHSGTYCNQWQAFDYKIYKKGTPASELPDNTFWIVEELPGMYQMQDMSWYLRENTYWPSFNLPYFPEIYATSGFEAAAEQYGDYYSYQNTNRHKIFRRGQSNITDLTSMQKMMRYNNFKNDPLSAIPNCTTCDPSRSPMLAIASRGDLAPLNYTPGNNSYGARFARKWFGACDAKVTSAAFMASFTTVAEAGPTHDDQPYLDWSDKQDNRLATMSGMLQKWDFSFVDLSVLSTAPPQEEKKSDNKLAIILGVSIGGGLLLIGIIATAIICYRRKGGDYDDADGSSVGGPLNEPALGRKERV